MNKALIALVILLIFGAVGYFYFLKPPEGSTQNERQFLIDYDVFTVKKTISYSEQGQAETIEMQLGLERSPYSIITFVPKKLAKNVSDIKISTNGSYKVLEKDPIIIFSPKNVANAIVAKLEFWKENRNATTINIVFPTSMFEAMSKAEKEKIIKELKAYESLDLNPEKVHKIENALAKKIVDLLTIKEPLLNGPEDKTVLLLQAAEAQKVPLQAPIVGLGVELARVIGDTAAQARNNTLPEIKGVEIELPLVAEEEFPPNELFPPLPEEQPPKIEEEEIFLPLCPNVAVLEREGKTFVVSELAPIQTISFTICPKVPEPEFTGIKPEVNQADIVISEGIKPYLTVELRGEAPNYLVNLTFNGEKFVEEGRPIPDEFSGEITIPYTATFGSIWKIPIRVQRDKRVSFTDLLFANVKPLYFKQLVEGKEVKVKAEPASLYYFWHDSWGWDNVWFAIPRNETYLYEVISRQITTTAPHRVGMGVSGNYALVYNTKYTKDDYSFESYGIKDFDDSEHGILYRRAEDLKGFSKADFENLEKPIICLKPYVGSGDAQKEVANGVSVRYVEEGFKAEPDEICASSTRFTTKIEAKEAKFDPAKATKKPFFVVNNLPVQFDAGGCGLAENTVLQPNSVTGSITSPQSSDEKSCKIKTADGGELLAINYEFVFIPVSNSSPESSQLADELFAGDSIGDTIYEDSAVNWKSCVDDFCACPALQMAIEDFKNKFNFYKNYVAENSETYKQSYETSEFSISTVLKAADYGNECNLPDDFKNLQRGAINTVSLSYNLDTKAVNTKIGHPAGSEIFSQRWLYAMRNGLTADTKEETVYTFASRYTPDSACFVGPIAERIQTNLFPSAPTASQTTGQMVMRQVCSGQTHLFQFSYFDKEGLDKFCGSKKRFVGSPVLTFPIKEWTKTAWYRILLGTDGGCLYEFPTLEGTEIAEVTIKDESGKTTKAKDPHVELVNTVSGWTSVQEAAIFWAFEKLFTSPVVEKSEQIAEKEKVNEKTESLLHEIELYLSRADSTDPAQRAVEALALVKKIEEMENIVAGNEILKNQYGPLLAMAKENLDFAAGLPKEIMVEIKNGTDFFYNKKMGYYILLPPKFKAPDKKGIIFAEPYYGKILVVREIAKPELAEATKKEHPDWEVIGISLVNNDAIAIGEEKQTLAAEKPGAIYFAAMPLPSDLTAYPYEEPTIAHLQKYLDTYQAPLPDGRIAQESRHLVAIIGIRYGKPYDEAADVIRRGRWRSSIQDDFRRLIRARIDKPNVLGEATERFLDSVRASKTLTKSEIEDTVSAYRRIIQQITEEVEEYTSLLRAAKHNKPVLRSGGILDPKDASRLVLGKNAETADVLFSSNNVSRTAAVIEKAPEGHYVISNLSSTSGTFVNGERISKPTVLLDGDVIRLADVQFAFADPSEKKWDYLLKRPAGYIYQGGWAYSLTDVRAEQGFKLHISADERSAARIAETVLPILDKEGIAHKILPKNRLLLAQNAGTAGESQIGKFIAIYSESNEQALQVALGIDRALAGKGLTGPKISKENMFGRSGLIYYRLSRYKGDMIKLPSGAEISDDALRMLPGGVPAEIEDPFVRYALANPGYMDESAIAARRLTGVPREPAIPKAVVPAEPAWTAEQKLPRTVFLDDFSSNQAMRGLVAETLAKLGPDTTGAEVDRVTNELWRAAQREVIDPKLSINSGQLLSDETFGLFDNLQAHNSQSIRAAKEFLQENPSFFRDFMSLDDAKVEFLKWLNEETGVISDNKLRSFLKHSGDNVILDMYGRATAYANFFALPDNKPIIVETFGQVEGARLITEATSLKELADATYLDPYFKGIRVQVADAAISEITVPGRKSPFVLRKKINSEAGLMQVFSQAHGDPNTYYAKAVAFKGSDNKWQFLFFASDKPGNMPLQHKDILAAFTDLKEDDMLGRVHGLQFQYNRKNKTITWQIDSSLTRDQVESGVKFAGNDLDELLSEMKKAINVPGIKVGKPEVPTELLNAGDLPKKVEIEMKPFGGVEKQHVFVVGDKRLKPVKVDGRLVRARLQELATSEYFKKAGYDATFISRGDRFGLQIKTPKGHVIGVGVIGDDGVVALATKSGGVLQLNPEIFQEVFTSTASYAAVEPWLKRVDESAELLYALTTRLEQGSKGALILNQTCKSPCTASFAFSADGGLESLRALNMAEGTPDTIAHIVGEAKRGRKGLRAAFSKVKTGYGRLKMLLPSHWVSEAGKLVYKRADELVKLRQLAKAVRAVRAGRHIAGATFKTKTLVYGTLIATGVGAVVAATLVGLEAIYSYGYSFYAAEKVEDKKNELNKIVARELAIFADFGKDAGKVLIKPGIWPVYGSPVIERDGTVTIYQAGLKDAENFVIRLLNTFNVQDPKKPVGTLLIEHASPEHFQSPALAGKTQTRAFDFFAGLKDNTGDSVKPTIGASKFFAVYNICGKDMAMPVDSCYRPYYVPKDKKIETVFTIDKAYLSKLDEEIKKKGPNVPEMRAATVGSTPVPSHAVGFYLVEARRKYEGLMKSHREFLESKPTCLIDNTCLQYEVVIDLTLENPSSVRDYPQARMNKTINIHDKPPLIKGTPTEEEVDADVKFAGQIVDYLEGEIEAEDIEKAIDEYEHFYRALPTTTSEGTGLQIASRLTINSIEVYQVRHDYVQRPSTAEMSEYVIVSGETEADYFMKWNCYPKIRESAGQKIANWALCMDGHVETNTGIFTN